MKKVYKRVVQRTSAQQQSNNSDVPHPFLQAQPTNQPNPSINQFPHQFKIQQKHQQNHPQVKVNHKNNADLEPNQQAKDRPDNVKKNIADQISISPNSHLKSELIPSQVSANTNATSNKNESKSGEEERKSKIEQLKQKYLKKGNTEAKTETNKANDAKRQIALQQPAIITIPIKMEAEQQQQAKQKVQNILKQQKKVAEVQQVIIKVQQKPEEQHKQIINKVFKPPVPNIVPRPKLVPTKQKEQQANDAQVKEAKQPIKQEQPSTIKSNTKIAYPPPPKTKNIAKYPPVLIPKHVEPQQIISITDKPMINQVKVAQLPHYHQEPTVIQPFKPQTKQDQDLISTHNKVEDAPQLGIQQQIRLWLQNPSRLLSRIIPNIDHLNNIGLEYNFTFASKNPQFNLALSDFLVEFVLKNKNMLSEGQKAALYNFALQYFVGGNQLSAQLMLILIKLGAPYLAKHSVEIKRSLQSSCQIIVSKKSLFSSEELNTVVNFMTEEKELSEKEILYLLLIYPSERLLTLLSNKTFNNANTILAFLCFINLKKEFTSLIMLYLKLISLLIDNMPQGTSLGQKILKHLNQLQTNDKSYQLHKQIKLKLITIISKSQQGQAKPIKNQVKQQKNDGGLVGYWTKAVDKIKTATTQLVDLKEPPKPAPKEQEKEEDIVYDPVLKRYLINGKVPDDQHQRPKDNQTSKAPPPPKQSNKPVPPPLPVKKAKVVTNRYA